MKHIIWVLVFSMIFSACGSKDVNKDVGSKNEIKNEFAAKADELEKDEDYTEEFEGISWGQDDLLALAFLGYNQYGDLQLYAESQDLEDFLYFLPELEDIQTVENGGDELYLIIPRYFESKILIKDKDGAELYSGNSEPILLQTNAGDIHADTELTVSYKDQEITVFPILSGMDSTLILPEYGVLDISYYTLYNFDYYESDIYSFEGDWYCNYYDPEGREKEILLTFSDLTSEDEEWYKLVCFDLNEGYEMKGSCYFRVPLDFWEPSDDDNDLIYIDLFGVVEGGPHQMFGKFSYEFLDIDNLVIKHFGYDPLYRGEDGFEYVFVRSVG